MAELRARVYALGAPGAEPPATAEPLRPAGIPEEPIAQETCTPVHPIPEELLLPAATGPEPIAPPLATEALCAEINGLPPESLLCACGDYQVWLTEAQQIPLMLREIGRQREIAFRQVGEGTGKDLDLDRFDQCYQHLFLWNQPQAELVGAYRLGLADVIVREHGVAGLYTSTLFSFDGSLFDRLGPMLELGRFFRALGVPAFTLSAVPALAGHRPISGQKSAISLSVRCGEYLR